MQDIQNELHALCKQYPQIHSLTFYAFAGIWKLRLKNEEESNHNNLIEVLEYLETL